MSKLAKLAFELQCIIDTDSENIDDCMGTLIEYIPSKSLEPIKETLDTICKTHTVIPNEPSDEILMQWKANSVGCSTREVYQALLKTIKKME